MTTESAAEMDKRNARLLLENEKGGTQADEAGRKEPTNREKVGLTDVQDRTGRP